QETCNLCCYSTQRRLLYRCGDSWKEHLSFMFVSAFRKVTLIAPWVASEASEVKSWTSVRDAIRSTLGASPPRLGDNLLQLAQTVYYGREYEEKKERQRKTKEKAEALAMAMKTLSSSKDPHLFPHKKQYPLKPEVKEGLKPIIENLKEQGLLVPCNSPCNTPILGVKKSNDNLSRDLQNFNSSKAVVLQYVDDILLCAETEEACSRASEDFLNFLAGCGYAVVTAEQVLEAKSLPQETSAQLAELVALTRALELSKGQRTPLIWTGPVEQEKPQYTEEELKRYEKRGAKITDKGWLQSEDGRLIIPENAQWKILKGLHQMEGFPWWTSPLQGKDFLQVCEYLRQQSHKLSLSPLYFNKTLLHKSSERSSLVSGPELNSSPPEAKNPAILKNLKTQCKSSDFFKIKMIFKRTTEDTDGGTLSQQHNAGPPLPVSSEKDMIRQMMIKIFRCIEPELNNLIALGDKIDSFNSLDMLVKMSRHVWTAQNVDPASFLSTTLGNVLVTVKRNFDKCISNQIRQMEEVKISKKSKVGILPFVAEFEEFAGLAESIFKNAECRGDLDKAYTKLIRGVFVNVEKVANESQKTPRDVLMMENFHHIFATLSRLKISCLEAEKKRSQTKKHRSPSHFFEGVEARVAQGMREEEVSYQLAFNKQELRKVIKEHPGKEVKKGLDNLYKKVDKHLCEEENLLQVVWHSMQDEFIRQYKHFEGLIARCYPGSGVTMEFTIQDILDYCSSIAQSH
ncbi:hypothetical protein FD755_023907, partial [Muntiacus reevesi]